MEQFAHSPPQSPPVERTYSRPVVGRNAKIVTLALAAATKKKHKKAADPDDNYLIELTTFHIRRGRGRR